MRTGGSAFLTAIDKTSVFNWEANTASMVIRYLRVIIRFLGYPLPEAEGSSPTSVRPESG